MYIYIYLYIIENNTVGDLLYFKDLDIYFKSNSLHIFYGNHIWLNMLQFLYMLRRYMFENWFLDKNNYYSI